MKKNFTSYLLVLFTLFVTATTVSAQSADAAAGSADRDKISTIMLDLFKEWDHMSFQNATGLFSEVAKFDMSNLFVEGLACVQDTKMPIEGTSDYSLLFSNKTFTGHFILKDGMWVKNAEADDLQLSYSDPSGVPCVLKITTSSDVKPTSLPLEGFLKDGEDSYMARHFASEEDGEDESSSVLPGISSLLKNLMENVKLINLEVPAKTSIELVYGGSTMMSTDIQVDHSSMGSTLFEGFMMDISTKFYKGVLDKSGSGVFELCLKNTGYKPGLGINVDFAIKKNDSQLISLKLNAPGTLNLGARKALLSRRAFADNLGSNLGLESLNVELDVMGKAQVKGGISDINTLLTMLSAMQDADEINEATVKVGLEMVNQLVNVDLYYDGSSVPAAKLNLLPAYDEAEGEWTAKPYINFTGDNSSCSVKEFFTAENFSDVAQAAMTIADEVSGLIEVVRETAKESVQRVDAINSQQEVTAKEWFTLSGTHTTGATKGLKIVRMSDGSVRKVMVK